MHVLKYAVIAAWISCVPSSVCESDPPENPPQKETKGFTYAGRPIHPAAIKEFSCWISDLLPTIAAIDLEGFTGSNKVGGSVVTENDGEVWLQNERICGKGYFTYRVLGCSSAGTWVLSTSEGGEGTMVWENLLFVRLEKDSVIVNEGRRDRVVLRCVGEYILGDRDDGSLRMEGNRVIIGKSRKREEEVTLTIE